jgi:hypothetical protein
MQRWKIDLALIPPASRLAQELVRDQRWTRWYCDSTAVILRRPPAPAGAAAPGSQPQACAELAPPDR